MSRNHIDAKPGIDATSIMVSELKGRIDPEYYSDSMLTLVEHLSKHETMELGSLGTITASAFYPAATHLYSTGTVPFARCVDCVKYPVIGRGQEDVFEKIPENFIADNKNVRTVSRGDMIITKVGTPCYASIVEDFDVIALSRTVLGLKDIKHVNPYYLLAYLRSEYGFRQLMRERELTIQYQLTLDRTAKVAVAIPSTTLQNSIAELIQKYQSEYNAFTSQYDEAVGYLNQALNLAGFEYKSGNTSSRTLSECLSERRFDSEYWQPKYQEIAGRVSHINQVKLGDIVDMQKGIEPGSEAYELEGKPFVRVSDFSIYGIEEVEKKISEELFDRQKPLYQPRAGEVLFTKDGTIGIAHAMHQDYDGLVSGAFLRLIPRTPLNIDYLALAINSLYCQAQIERMTGGAIIAHLKPDDVKRIMIPLLSEADQAKLSKQVAQSLALRNKATGLMAKAKAAVEIFIEQGEDSALRFIHDASPF